MALLTCPYYSFNFLSPFPTPQYPHIDGIWPLGTCPTITLFQN